MTKVQNTYVLRTQAFLSDYIDENLNEISNLKLKGTRDPDIRSRIEFQLTLLRENLAWLDYGLRIGYFAISDEMTLSIATKAVDEYRSTQRFASEARQCVANSLTARRVECMIDSAFIHFWNQRFSVLLPSNNSLFSMHSDGVENHDAFDRSLSIASEESTVDLLFQNFILYFAYDSEWSFYRRHMSLAVEPVDFRIFDSTRNIEMFSWIFSETVRPKSLKEVPLAPNVPSAWRSDLPLRNQQSVFGYLGSARRRVLFEFLGKYSRIVLKSNSEDLDDDSLNLFEDILENLRERVP